MKALLTIILFFATSNLTNAQSLCTYYLDLSHHHTYNRDYEKAIYFANKALKMYPDSSRCYFERGGAYYFSGNLNEALNDLDSFVRLQPNNSEGYYWRGMILSDFKFYAKAEEDYLKSIELGKSDEIIKFKLAEAYLFQKKHDQSEELLLELLKIDPEKASIYNLMGLLYEERKNYAQSIEHFTNGIAIDKNYVSFYYNRARVNSELGNKDAACNDWAIAKSLGAEDADIWMEINNCEGLQGLSEADKIFDKQELSTSIRKNTVLTITSDYLPLQRLSRYTYTSNFGGKIDTSAAVVVNNDPNSDDFRFDIWNQGDSDLQLLYFEILGASDFRCKEDKFDLLMLDANSEVVATALFPRVFTSGKKITIENTWNPKATYAIKDAILSLEGIEQFKMPDGKTEECVKLRIEMIMNNGRSNLSYLWLVKDFGMVKWRNSAGRTWELIRYAIPSYGSFPPEESRYLLPPPEEVPTSR